jgi:MinD-like ATPase involved in chromosome partitioning or flagellar assembly
VQDIPGVFGIPAHFHAEPVDLRLVSLEQFLESLASSRARRREELLVRSERSAHDLMLLDTGAGASRWRQADCRSWRGAG